MDLVVVGDCLLDEDVHGSVHRKCPGTTAPVLDQREVRVRAGGAGLAARFAQDDHTATVTLVSAIADDADGHRLRDHLGGMRTVLGGSTRSTPVKTRLLADGHPIARVDRGGQGPAPTATDEMLAAVRAADAVLVADYGCGLTADARLRSVLTEVAQRRPVVWDPHPRGSDPVPGVTVVPNLAEATHAAHRLEPSEAASELHRRWRAAAVVVTLGERGALLHSETSSETSSETVPAVAAPDGADTCGAGDRFASAMALALMRGTGLRTATELAVACSAEFVAAGIRPSTADNRAHAVVARTRALGGTVVATGGCFDLLHTGHARTLRAARDLGDCLVVCLNSDDSIRRLKGPGRPIVGVTDRAELLAALGCVDAVVVFDEDGPERVLADLRPDVWVKGGDYRADELPEAALVRSWGGSVVVAPLHAGRSTTAIARTIHEEEALCPNRM